MMSDAILNTINNLSINSIIKVIFVIFFIGFSFFSFLRSYKKYRHSEVCLGKGNIQINEINDLDLLDVTKTKYSPIPNINPINMLLLEPVALFYQEFHELSVRRKVLQNSPVNLGKEFEKDFYYPLNGIRTLISKTVNSLPESELKYEKYLKAI